RLVIPEVERRRQFAARIHELHAVLLHEMALLHFRQHVEPFQYPVGLGNEGFADMKPGKAFALEQLYLVAVLGQQRRDSGPRRPTTNDDDIRGIHDAPVLLNDVSASTFW